MRRRSGQRRRSPRASFSGPARGGASWRRSSSPRCPCFSFSCAGGAGRRRGRWCFSSGRPSDSARAAAGSRSPRRPHGTRSSSFPPSRIASTGSRECWPISGAAPRREPGGFSARRGSRSPAGGIPFRRKSSFSCRERCRSSGERTAATGSLSSGVSSGKTFRRRPATSRCRGRDIECRSRARSRSVGPGEPRSRCSRSRTSSSTGPFRRPAPGESGSIETSAARSPRFFSAARRSSTAGWLPATVGVGFTISWWSPAFTSRWLRDWFSADSDARASRESAATPSCSSRSFSSFSSEARTPPRFERES